MKKVLSIIFIILLTGCSQKYITCKIDLENSVDNYSQKSTYKIYYKNSYVTKIEKNDIYKSNDSNEIEYLNEINTLMLNNHDKGYTFEINKKKNSLSIDTIIDVNELDLKKLILDEVIDRDYVSGNHLTKSGLVKFYESKGAKCDI